MKDREINIGKVIKQLRERKGYSQRQLALYSEVSNTEISRIENGERKKVSPDTLRKLAKPLEVSYEYLLEAAGHIEDSKLDVIPVGKPTYLPVVGTVKAGPCGVAFEEILGEEWVEEDEINGGEYFWLKVKGDSMYPNFFPGDFVLIRRQPIVEDGQIAVVIVDKEEGCLKRVRLLPNGFALESINPAYPTRYFVGQEAENLMIVGVYKQLKRK